ncbi:hypothetical protein [Histidinibacterium aquaticum]|nr:hypothetical protein [Histidinibacterium aquaticum]
MQIVKIVQIGENLRTGALRRNPVQIGHGRKTTERGALADLAES